MEKKHIDGQAAHVIARCGDIPVFTAPLPVLTQLTGFALTRGILCAMQRRSLPAAEEICASARGITVLENVMNPTNIGAIFRSAAALGMDGIMLTDKCADPFYRRAARVSMGTCFQIPWTKAGREESEGTNLIRTLQSYGYKTVAMALTEDSVGIDDPEIRKHDKLAIILGTEGTGLPKEVISVSDYRVMIPMHHGVDSLNVAAASAVSFWELSK